MSPYEILGTGALASDDEIKQAYRKKAFEITGGMSGEMSPENQSKMAELNNAYDTILSSRRSNSSYTGSTTASYGQYSTASDYASLYIELRKKFHEGSYDEVDMLLDTVPDHDRSGEWYYMKSQVQYKKGWFTDAKDNIATACAIDPTNSEYRNFYNRLNGDMAGGYRTNGKKDMDCCDICAAISCIDCLCEASGHDCIRCC